MNHHYVIVYLSLEPPNKHECFFLYVLTFVCYDKQPHFLYPLLQSLFIIFLFLVIAFTRTFLSLSFSPYTL